MAEVLQSTYPKATEEPLEEGDLLGRWDALAKQLSMTRTLLEQTRVYVSNT